jgi:rSAM/selenodomain-associated transferase 2
VTFRWQSENELRVSVVMPVLDEAALIGERLRGLARFGFHEIIVVDGGSRDETRTIVANVPGVLLVDAARGRANQMNEGAKRATGEILLFLHADVALPEDAATHIHRVFDDAGTVAGAFRTWTVPDEPGSRPWWSPLLHLADLRSRYSGLPYGDQALFVRRGVFDAAGGFPDLPLMEDLALSRRLRRLGAIRIARASVRVSGRRFIERPLFYTMVINAFPLLYRCGARPAWLARIYKAVR